MWSAKLISGSGGTQGVNQWEMIYDASVQTALRAHYNFSIGNEAPEVLYHTPDGGSPIPIRATGKNRLIFLGMNVDYGTGWDDILDSLIPINRLVDGPDSQAIRAQIDGDVDKVKVAIKPDGATYTTYFDVLEGFVDTSQAFTSPAAVLNTMAYNVTIALTCKPLGYGDSFTLFNYLPSSPHFVEDSNADGLADGWSESGSGTPVIDTTHFLSGGRAQKLTTTAAGEYLFSSNINVANGLAMNASACVYLYSGSVSVLIRNTSDGTTLASATLTANDGGGVSDKSYTDSAGGVFYRVPVSGTNSTGSAKNYQIWIYALSACAFTVDNCHFGKGTLTQPKAFASAYTVYNRNDPETNTAYINYIDVWGIPGDAPATMRIKATGGVTNAQGLFVLGRAVDGILAAGALTHRLEGEDFSVDLGPTNGSGSTPSDANRHSGAYYRLTASGGVGSVILFKTSDGSAARAIATGLRRVYAICRSSSTATRFYIQYSSESSFTTNSPVSPTATNTWELHDMGTMALDGKMTLTANIPDSANEPRVNIKIGVDSVPDGGTADVDALFFLPTKEFMINSNLGVDSTDPQIWFDGHNEFVVIEATGAIIDTTLGSMWNLQPGPVMNRIMMLTSATTKAHTLTDNYTLSLEVIPRTRHLLGTI